MVSDDDTEVPNKETGGGKVSSLWMQTYRWDRAAEQQRTPGVHMKRDRASTRSKPQVTGQARQAETEW